MSDCVFCKIRDGEVPAKFEYRDEHTMVFHDLNPVAPHHLLVVPNRCIRSVNEVDAEAAAELGYMFAAAATVARKLGFDQEGYRCVVNTGRGAGQVVMHLHMHLLAGRLLEWPPG